MNLIDSEFCIRCQCIYIVLYVKRLEEGREFCFLLLTLMKITFDIVSSFVLTDLWFLFSIETLFIFINCFEYALYLTLSLSLSFV